MLTYTDSDCEQLMQKIDGTLDGLLQFWRTHHHWLTHVDNISGFRIRETHAVMDLGCGNGQFLHAYKILNPKAIAYGMNAFPSQIKRCKSPVVTLYPGDITNAKTYWGPLSNIGFRKVFCNYTLGHIEKSKWGSLIETVLDHLEPGGEFIVWDVCQKNVEKSEIYGYQLYHPSEVISMLEAEGFDITYEVGNQNWILHPDLYALLDAQEIDSIVRYTCPVLITGVRL